MAAEGRPRLLLLDGHSLAYRAYYALPVENFATTTGQATNAVHGFTSMLLNALRDERPTHVAVAFDVSRTTFRTEQFPQYKATRAASPEQFRGQIDLIREVLDAMGIHALLAPGFEADDIIATLATKGASAGFDVSIISGDRDTFALIGPRVTVLYPVKGVSDLSRMDSAAVLAKYGLTPEQYPDFAALRGDPSDNLPGIPGVGEKTAVKWLNEYGSLAQLVDRVAEVGGKAGDALRAALGQVLTNRSLTELVRDVPIEVELTDLELAPIDPSRVEPVFEALQFRALRERLRQLPSAASPPAEAVPALDQVVLTAASISTWLAEVGAGPVAIEVAGTWSKGVGQLDAIAIAGERAVGVANLAEISDIGPLADWLGDAAIAKVCHDAKLVRHVLSSGGLQLRGLTLDTALAAYLVAPGTRTFELGQLMLEFLGRELPTGRADQDQLALEFEGTSGRDLAMRAAGIRDLALRLRQELEERGATALMLEVELPVAELLVAMEQAGIAVDRSGLVALEADFASQTAAAESAAHELAGRAFNLGSPKQLQEILFEERRLPHTKRIKTGYTTDADALLWLTGQSDDPLPGALLAWRDVSRLRQTVAGLLPLIGSDERIHTTFNQLVAATGRLSSTDPNLQNIPVRTAAGRRIRSTFISGPDFSELMTADYSQIELRIMAHLSGDPGLIEAFRSGEDLHNTMAAAVFGVSVDAVEPEMRRRIKAMSYGLAYGLSAYGLSQQLGIVTGDATRLIDDYLTRFGGVRDYLNSVVARAREVGYTETVLGRRRYLPDLTSTNQQRREMAERMALNAPIQGSAADLVKVAMLRVAEGLRQAGLQTRILLQVHDELVLEVAPGEREPATEIVRAGMSGAYQLDVPLDVSVGYGLDWDTAAH